MKPSEVLNQLNALRDQWRQQAFSYTPEQQKEYDRLLKLRKKE